MHRPLLCLGMLGLTVSFARTVCAQDNSTAPTAPTTASSAQNADSSQKKVWTNEDVPDLRADSKISTVGGGKNRQTRTSNSSSSTTGSKSASWYRDQIERLQKQLPPINEKIAQLQSALDGNFTGDSKTSSRPTGVQGGDWRTQLAQLQNKHDDIEAKIAELRDEARHAGVPPNTLP